MNTPRVLDCICGRPSVFDTVIGPMCPFCAADTTEPKTALIALRGPVSGRVYCPGDSVPAEECAVVLPVV